MNWESSWGSLIAIAITSFVGSKFGKSGKDKLTVAAIAGFLIWMTYLFLAEAIKDPSKFWGGFFLWAVIVGLPVGLTWLILGTPEVFKKKRDGIASESEKSIPIEK